MSLWNPVSISLMEDTTCVSHFEKAPPIVPQPSFAMNYERILFRKKKTPYPAKPQITLFTENIIQKQELYPPFEKIQNKGNEKIGHKEPRKVLLRSTAVLPGAKLQATNCNAMCETTNATQIHMDFLSGSSCSLFLSGRSRGYTVWLTGRHGR